MHAVSDQTNRAVSGAYCHGYLEFLDRGLESLNRNGFTQPLVRAVLFCVYSETLQWLDDPSEMCSETSRRFIISELIQNRAITKEINGNKKNKKRSNIWLFRVCVLT
jgi:hypothetical protein